MPSASTTACKRSIYTNKYGEYVVLLYELKGHINPNLYDLSRM